MALAFFTNFKIALTAWSLIHGVSFVSEAYPNQISWYLFSRGHFQISGIDAGFCWAALRKANPSECNTKQSFLSDRLPARSANIKILHSVKFTIPWSRIIWTWHMRFRSRSFNFLCWPFLDLRLTTGSSPIGFFIWRQMVAFKNLLFSFQF